MLSSSSRLLRVLSLLQTRSHWAGNELAEQVEVHPRTLRRDIDRLRELGYPIHASSGVAGGYAFRAGQALPPLLLDDDEALAVAIALRLATEGTVGGVEESSLRALVKLEQVMPKRLHRRITALRSAILPMGRVGPAVDAGLLAMLAAACRDQLRLGFAYSDRQGQRSARTVEPLGLVHTGRHWYLVAWDPARDDWRTFRIDRIADVPVTGTHFTPRAAPEGGDLRAYVSRSLAVSPHAEQAQVVFHQPREALARRIPPSAGVLETLDDGRCLLTCGANDLDWLAGWLLMVDVEFEVRSPAALVERLRVAGERIAHTLARRGGSAGP